MNLVKKIGILALILLVFISNFYISNAETEVAQAEGVPTTRRTNGSF